MKLKNKKLGGGGICAPCAKHGIVPLQLAARDPSGTFKREEIFHPPQDFWL